MTPRVLSIAGTDPTGGAGIHADLKSIGALGGYGMAVITAIVSQNTAGVRDVFLPPLEVLRSQLRAVSDDVQIDAIKLGMLHSEPVIAFVRAWLKDVAVPIVVLDPVMVATSGDRLMDEEAEQAMRDLLTAVTVVTPNLAELAVLAESDIARTWDDALAQATAIQRRYGTAVVMKGGHLGGGSSDDALVTADDVVVVPGRRVSTHNTHGTGCSLSAAIATVAASGASLPNSLRRAKSWLTGALEASDALRVGHGNGPIDHFHETRPLLPEAGWTDRLWRESRAVRDEAEQTPFVQSLGSGSLPRDRFEWYLQQDALYLAEYSRVLATASAIAPTTAEQLFWSQSATGALIEAAQLHEIEADLTGITAAESTLAYTDHLHAAAASGSYAVLTAAVLPCFWLYQDLGERLAARAIAEHPYRSWLEAYSDAEFTVVTRGAIDLVEQIAARARSAERARMAAAFHRSMRLERDFFAAPLARL